MDPVNTPLDSLNGKTILVTGASRGIGAATVARLGAAGARVIAHWNHDGTGVRNATDGIPEDRKFLIQADLLSVGGARDLWRKAIDLAEKIDVVVNNAGVLPRAGIDASNVEWDDAWDLALQVNAASPVELMRLATRHYIETGGGILITLSSWVAHRGSGSPNLIAYASSKAAVTAATKTIARTQAANGILAYCIAPGPVATEMTTTASQDLGGEASVQASLAMGEMVPPFEIAELITFLAAGHVRHLSGGTLDITGATYIR